MIEASSLTRFALRRRAGADCTALLRRVATQLALSGCLPTPLPVDEISGSFVTLRYRQSRTYDPELGPTFSSTPAGTWTTGRVFVADGGGEVFLNLNERDGIGEFSIMDEDDADVVVNELAKILLPRAG